MFTKKNIFNTTVKAAATVVAIVALLSTSTVVMAQEITAADYVAMDLHARQLTVDGVKDRLALLQLGADLDTQLQQDAETQQDVEAAYQQYDMTASSAIAWATQHRQAIIDWLANNADQQSEYDRIAKELDTVSTQIQTLANQ